MKVFIDTNILLDIFQLSGPDLEELRKLVKLVEKKKVELLVSQQVIDEFWRNREGVIAAALKTFRETKAIAKVPNIIRSYSESHQLKETVDNVNELVKTLIQQVTQDIQNNTLKADDVLKELFATIKFREITTKIIDRAKLRTDIGNPPGKKGSIGDAINWEWLLDQETEFWDDELILISADGDFESELTNGKPKEFLLREWEKKNPECHLLLEKSLTDFLKHKFPDIELAEEVEKIEAIERLENSSNFKAAHKAIALLSGYDDFKDAEAKRIINAYLENNQISWILEDDDIKEFARKIISMPKKPETKELASSLKEMLDQLDGEDPPF